MFLFIMFSKIFNIFKYFKLDKSSLWISYFFTLLLADIARIMLVTEVLNQRIGIIEAAVWAMMAVWMCTCFVITKVFPFIKLLFK